MIKILESQIAELQEELLEVEHSISKDAIKNGIRQSDN